MSICVLITRGRENADLTPDETSETDMADDPTLAAADARPMWTAPNISSFGVIRTLMGSGSGGNTDAAIGSHDAPGSTMLSPDIL